MGIEELAKRKAELKLSLESMQYTNVADATVEFLTDLNIAQIKARKELYEVEAKIEAYIKSAA